MTVYDNTGILCPKCGGKSHTTTDTRHNTTGRRRRKECHACGSRFTTYEMTEALAKATGIMPLIKSVLSIGRSAAYRKTMRENRR